jgi:hypothetical protein
MNGLRAGMSAAPLMAAARMAAGVTSLPCQKRASILDCCSAGNTSGGPETTFGAPPINRRPVRSDRCGGGNLGWRPEFAQCFQISYTQSTFV